ncbi:hypothetical protein H5410_046335 [Solanum commersonii]|uniref:Uncharacterized protein n=1 Tax=Solanum commersonii TaxID=4109 RepID=A0A9J5XE22_SOLCO|nr:hypothetical protein H5410_046335 [Solanum commersonii]
MVSLFSSQTPTLQKFAMKVLSLICSSFGFNKYNRILKRRYDAHDTIDAIALENIDESNEWLVGCLEDQEDKLVYEEGDLTWGIVATAIVANENIYGLRGISSSSMALDKDKGV